jgi:hypothetical protein
MVWGLGRLCLLFPSGLLPRLDAKGRAALLAHELAHVRRRDHWVRVLELVVTGLYWWHPAVWWARREVREAEEVCCDAWAVWASGGHGRPYAVALLQVVAFVSRARLPLPAGASGVGQVSHLKRRLAMVMQGNTSRSLSGGSLGLVLGLGLLFLPLFPARGQEAAPSAKDSRDQQIDALKKAIDVLEQQKKQEPSMTPKVWMNEYRAFTDKLAAGAAQDLKAELQALEQAIAIKKKELQDLEARSQALRAQLTKASPRPDQDPTSPWMRTIRTPAAKAQDVEEKLNRLLKEVEELRREVHGNRPTGQRPSADPNKPSATPIPKKPAPPVPPAQYDRPDKPAPPTRNSRPMTPTDKPPAPPTAETPPGGR